MQIKRNYPNTILTNCVHDLSNLISTFYSIYPALIVLSLMLSTHQATAQTTQSNSKWAIDSRRFSVVGTRLGMTEPQMLGAIDSELQKSVTKKIYTDLGLTTISIYAGDEDCHWAYVRDQGIPCLGFHALLFDETAGNLFQITVLRLDQYFDRPVPIDDMTNRIISAYGKPDIKIEKMDLKFDPQKPFATTTPEGKWSDGTKITVPPFSPIPVWIWSEELSVIKQTDRVKLLDGAANPGQIGLSLPLLRIYMNVEDSLVKGMSVVVIDPILLDQRGVKVDKRLNEQKKEVDSDNAAKIKLQ